MAESILKISEKDRKTIDDFLRGKNTSLEEVLPNIERVTIELKDCKRINLVYCEGYELEEEPVVLLLMTYPEELSEKYGCGFQVELQRKLHQELPEAVKSEIFVSMQYA